MKIAVFAAILIAMTGGTLAAPPVSMAQVDGPGQGAFSVADLNDMLTTFGSTAVTIDTLRNRPLTGGSAFVSSQEGNLNVISSEQAGPDNYGLINQSGDYNSAAIQQIGARNIGLIFQSGNANAASIRQLGQNHTAVVMQRGTGNVAIVAQR